MDRHMIDYVICQYFSKWNHRPIEDTYLRPNLHVHPPDHRYDGRNSLHHRGHRSRGCAACPAADRVHTGAR